MVALAVLTPPADLRLATEIRGAAGRLWDDASGEIVISGPAGTGKTRAILEWIHARCGTERLRVLFLRKTLESLKASALVTFQEQVLYDFDGRQSPADGVVYFGGNKLRPAEFAYVETGSKIILAGMDNASKVLSTEYDLIFVNEATELTLDEWEKLTGRADRPRLGTQRPPSLVLGDCNPDVPTHWIRQRESGGKLKLWPTTHEDNPAMWDRFARQWTPAGLRYLARLDANTGVRYLRLRLGQWVAAEGQVYDGWNDQIHVVPRFDIPAEWPRYWAVDFGFKNPFVWLDAAEGPDGDLFVTREIYMTERLVSDHARQIMQVTAGETKPTAIVTDHDAEDRATFERETGYTTRPAPKSVSPGIQAVANRLRRDGERSPRLRFFRDALVERDRSLAEAGKPTCTAEEFPGYIWDTGQGRRTGEQPAKINDHGADAVRYLTLYRDAGQPGWSAVSPDVAAWFSEGGVSA